MDPSELHEIPTRKGSDGIDPCPQLRIYWLLRAVSSLSWCEPLVGGSQSKAGPTPKRSWGTQIGLSGFKARDNTRFGGKGSDGGSARNWRRAGKNTFCEIFKEIVKNMI